MGHLREGVIGLTVSGSKQRRRDADAGLVQTAAWAVMKAHFAEVVNWAVLPYGALLRLRGWLYGPGV